MLVSLNIFLKSDTPLVGNCTLYWHTALEAFPCASPQTKCMSTISAKENKLVHLLLEVHYILYTSNRGYAQNVEAVTCNW
jgi:hypothetical protein